MLYVDGDIFVPYDCMSGLAEPLKICGTGRGGSVSHLGRRKLKHIVESGCMIKQGWKLGLPP